MELECLLQRRPPIFFITCSIFKCLIYLFEPIILFKTFQTLMAVQFPIWSFFFQAFFKFLFFKTFFLHSFSLFLTYLYFLYFRRFFYFYSLILNCCAFVFQLRNREFHIELDSIFLLHVTKCKLYNNLSKLSRF